MFQRLERIDKGFIDMPKELVILLSYFGAAFIFALCVFAYQCYEYKGSRTMLKWEYWYDFEKGSTLFMASYFFPLTIIVGLCYIPFWLIKKLFKVE
jgi:hypothetical protein